MAIVDNGVMRIIVDNGVLNWLKANLVLFAPWLPLAAPPEQCSWQTALACLADVGNEIMTAKTQGDDFDYICK